ncbi:MAG: coenzyme F420 hydrogenase [Planctomycetota bacterium]|nr:MAG: coenzyme F420 hydrogenase [Planctomycetota bacterium]
MVDDLRSGRRPEVDPAAPVDPAASALSLAVCPGASLDWRDIPEEDRVHRELFDAWGPVRRVVEGFAADEEIRRMGSSGGAATALALHCIEREGMAGALHIAADPHSPVFNRTVFSRDRTALLAATGSRYAPASPCEGLGRIEQAEAPCVFIGKPCDVAAARRLVQRSPALQEKLGATIAFFCAGAPSTEGTLQLLRQVGVEDPDRVTSLRYRGDGWPGRWTVRWRDASGRERVASLSYEESWGFLQAHRQWRCSLCPDHTGEFADIAVGDPWWRPPEEGGDELGRSLIVARTERGEALLAGAIAAGALVVEREDAALLPRSQPNLLRARASVWGRALGARLAGGRTPRFIGAPLRTLWWRELGALERIRSVVGAFRRVRRRRLNRPTPVAGSAERAAEAKEEQHACAARD